jgi:hypothetical protein
MKNTPKYNDHKNTELEASTRDWDLHKNYGAENGENRYPLEVRAPFRGEKLQVAALYHYGAEYWGNLITAAPDMLEELESILTTAKLREINTNNVAGLNELLRDIAGMANAAIAKARGESL